MTDVAPDSPVDPYTGKVGNPTRTKHISHPPSRSTDHDVRCWRCKRLLIEMATRPWRVTCSRCKAANESPPIPNEPSDPRPDPEGQPPATG